MILGHDIKASVLGYLLGYETYHLLRARNALRQNQVADQKAAPGDACLVCNQIAHLAVHLL